jgi:hypothetical protein
MGFRVVAPVEIEAGDRQIAFDVWLPDFGGSAGMLLLRADGGDSFWGEGVWDRLIARGYGLSVLDTHDGDVDVETIRGVLWDWGWAGSAAERPQWLFRFGLGENVQTRLSHGRWPAGSCVAIAGRQRLADRELYLVEYSDGSQIELADCDLADFGGFSENDDQA